eukprot:GHVO01045261.1.p1 GENE.GHVO01045261.1~~GHVO01045261.1.p1  ORF type:complete len:110 (-),score=20.05 GHVO01045261.1:72-401(-)
MMFSNATKYDMTSTHSGQAAPTPKKQPQKGPAQDTCHWAPHHHPPSSHSHRHDHHDHILMIPCPLTVKQELRTDRRLHASIRVSQTCCHEETRDKKLAQFSGIRFAAAE